MVKEMSLVIHKETIYDKITRNLLMLIYPKDFFMIQRLEEFIQPKRPNPSKIIIPKEIRKIEVRK